MEHHDYIVIGAGVGGIYQIKCLTDMGFDALLLEADDDLGGTWYRNRYPGARFDSESYTYGYSFSRELLDEWHWKERYSGQPENLRYLNFVADKFSLRQYMRFNCRVISMAWQEAESVWQLTLESHEVITARFVITGVGPLSKPTFPAYPGMNKFSGQSFHTYWWPKEPLSLAGTKAGIVGTGATAIQIIPEIAPQVAHLTVFQRRPNWSAPLNNSVISEQEMAEIRTRYDEIFATCAMTAGGFEHVADARGFWNVSREERVALWDRLYDEPGFGIWLQNFIEIFTDEEANAEFSAYIADRIRQRVNDPVTAEKLIPKDHGFGIQRLPLETHYYEAYNRDNVTLVDIAETPVTAVTETGIATSDNHYDLDLIIYATGFDALTGAYDQIDIRGVNGIRLVDCWQEGPVTWLGTMVHHFPNLIMIAGPQSGSASTNFPRAIETNVKWISQLLTYVHANGLKRIEPTAEAESRWVEEVANS
ncbi:MAG: NAD(P)/FAD-dependent oxidoreductase [Pseudomonadales bacterium]|nr:NAD(P)/FAD-dependent oxidoreductase [Pseudomonadales bacterium]